MTERDRQFYAALTALVFSIFILVGLGHFRMEQMVKDVFVSDKLQNTLTEAIAQIDAERLIRLKNNPGDPYGQELRDMLEIRRTQNGWSGIYLIIKDFAAGGREPWVFLLDSRSPADPLAVAERSFVHDIPLIVVEKAYWGKEILGQGYKTKNGARIAGFAPVGYGLGDEAGPAGENLAVAVLVVEYDAVAANSFIYQTLYVQFGVLIIGMVLIFLVGRQVFKEFF